MKEQGSHRAYEENVPDLKRFFSKLEDEEVYLFVSGEEEITGSILAVLQQLKDKVLNVVYIRPNRRLLNKTCVMIERAAYGVLQELARSAALNRIILVDTAHIMQYTKGVKIIEINDRLRRMLASSFHMLNYFKNSKGVINTAESPESVNRISTFGYVDSSLGQEIYFYPLDSVREKVYYFAIAEDSETWDSHEKLLDNIEKQLKDEKVDSSYKVISTTYDENHVYMEMFTNVVQLIFKH